MNVIVYSSFTMALVFLVPTLMLLLLDFVLYAYRIAHRTLHPLVCPGKHLGSSKVKRDGNQEKQKTLNGKESPAITKDSTSTSRQEFSETITFRMTPAKPRNFVYETVVSG
ncbi:unnamed protein product [Kuraishia capsulata CBS 1993]|uniref:Uncharacterized protein n=1 Tax=Kuraishia capsulata CBS 1993 TaxID=1382522 RepID=W6MH73_9ASCO|nr:uncharacterized protein KUCA_T00001524001 [Kuraishia capsulata CBS 1993]CDK25554.1 unnamed protein product [Kuraishia capsulata CBS 1993]